MLEKHGLRNEFTSTVIAFIKGMIFNLYWKLSKISEIIRLAIKKKGVVFKKSIKKD